MDGLEKLFINAIGKLNGKICWSIIGGSERSDISIKFGKKIPRKKPIPNIHLTDDEKLYEGEYSFLIECTWRLESNDKVLHSWMDASPQNKLLQKRLKRLINSKVKKVEVSLPFYDLSIYFSNSLCLKIFCDQTTDEYDNYSFYTPGKVYTVGCCSKLKFEKSQE